MKKNEQIKTCLGGDDQCITPQRLVSSVLWFQINTFLINIIRILGININFDVELCKSSGFETNISI